MEKMTPALACVFPDVPDAKSTIHLLISASHSARRTGLLFLEAYGMGYRLPLIYEFYEVAMQQIVDGTDPEFVKIYYNEQSKYLIERLKLRFQKWTIFLKKSRDYKFDATNENISWSIDNSEEKLLSHFFQKPYQYPGIFIHTILSCNEAKRPISELHQKFKDYLFYLQMFIDICRHGILSIQQDVNPRIVKYSLNSIAGFENKAGSEGRTRELSGSIKDLSFPEVKTFIDNHKDYTTFEIFISLLQYSDSMKILRHFTFYDLAVSLFDIEEHKYRGFLQRVPVWVDQMIREEIGRMDYSSDNFLEKVEANRKRIIQFCQDNFPDVTTWIKKNTNDQTLP